MTEKKVPCEVYSRIVGYLRPVHTVKTVDGVRMLDSDWNLAKRQEFLDRKTYDLKEFLGEDA